MGSISITSTATPALFFFTINVQILSAAAEASREEARAIITLLRIAFRLELPAWNSFIYAEAVKIYFPALVAEPKKDLATMLKIGQRMNSKEKIR